MMMLGVETGKPYVPNLIDIEKPIASAGGSRPPIPGGWSEFGRPTK